MPNTGKTGKDRGKIPTQSKLTDFGVQSKKVAEKLAWRKAEVSSPRLKKKY